MKGHCGSCSWPMGTILTDKQEDQQVSRFNGMKKTAPAKKDEKEIVTDGLAALAKAHQQSEGG